jgi:hypothetical protein
MTLNGLTFVSPQESSLGNPGREEKWGISLGGNLGHHSHAATAELF